MRNLKKLLAVIVAVTTLLTFAIPAFAADAAPAAPAASKIASDLGVLKGDTADGVTAAYLAKGTTRLQAAILQLRLLGKEAEAYAETATENFADATLVTWADGKALLAYLKKNPDLGWVGTDGKFDPNGLCTAQMLYKVLLESLGYKTGTDFQYADAIKFAGTKGLTGLAAMTNLTNDNVATGLVEALKAKTSDGAKTLAQKLVDNNIITDAAAVTAGLVVAAKALDVKAAVALNSKVVEVTLNTAAIAKDIAAAGAVTVKDSAAKDVAVSKIEFAPWATDGKDLLVTLGADTTAGTVYTVTCGTVSKTFGGQAADTAKPTVSKVESTDYNQATITFSEPILLGGTVAFAKSYGDKAALASTTITYDGSSKIKVATADQTDATLYAATIKGYKDLAGNAMDDSTDKTFVGQSKSTSNLKTDSAWVNNADEALVKFNLKVDTTTIDPANFKVEEAYGAKTVMTVTAARIATTDDKDSAAVALGSADAAKTVVLSITGLKDSTMYKVTVSNCKSTVGTAMDGTTNNTTFVGKAKPTSVFAIGTPTAKSNTSVTVTFPRKVDKATAETVANYAITLAYGTKATLAVSAAALQSNGTDVKLTVAAMTNDLYKIVVTNLKDIYGNAIDTANNSTTFVGAAVAAKITSVSGVLNSDGNVLTLTFDQNVGATLTDVSHYSISDSIGYPSKAYADDADTPNAKIVKLAIPKTTDGKTYTITVKGLENADGIAMDAAGITGTFVGRGNAATLPEAQGVVALSNSKLEIYFDRAADGTGMSNIWQGTAPFINNSAISIIPNVTGGAELAGGISGAYKDPANANGLILVFPANTFKANQGGLTYNTLKLTFKQAYVKPTNSANTVLTSTTNDTASYGPKMIGVVAVNKKQLTVIFDQPLTAVANDSFRANSDTGMTKNTQASNTAFVDKTDKTKVNVYFSSVIAEDEAGTSADNQFMLQIPAAKLAGVVGLGGLTAPVDKVGESSPGTVQSIAFAGSTTAQALGLDSGIYGVFTDKQTMKIYFPEVMDKTTVIPTNITIHSYVGSTDTHTYAPDYIAYADADNTAIAYFPAAVIDSTAGVTSYKLEMTTAVHNQAGLSVCADKSASSLATYKSQVAPGTSDAGKPAISSVAVDDTRTKVTVTFDREVVFGNAPDFSVAAADNTPGDADKRVDAAAVAVNAADLSTIVNDFNLNTTRGDGATYDHQLTTTTTEGLYATAVSRKTDNKSIQITLSAALKAGENVQVKLLKTATVYSWDSVQNKTDADGSAVVGGVASTVLYDTVAPVFLAKASYGTDSDNDGKLNTVTLVFDENIAFVTAPTNQATAQALFTTLTVADAAGPNDLLPTIADQTKVVITDNKMVITLGDTVSGTGLITCDLANGIVKDSSGNVIGNAASDTLKDTVAPVILTVVSSAATPNANDVITFTFSEVLAMNEDAIANFTETTAGAGTLKADSTPAVNNNVATVMINDATWANGDSIKLNNIVDDAANALNSAADTVTFTDVTAMNNAAKNTIN